MKSEPSVYGIDDLAAQPRQTDIWDGIRNYQARNMLRDQMKRGDQAFFYHSNTTQPGIVGIVKIARGGYPDDTAFDPNDPHYDPKSQPDKPRWYRVDVKLVRKLKRVITLTELKNHQNLSELQLVKRGNRLSIMPISAEHWNYILSLENTD